MSDEVELRAAWRTGVGQGASAGAAFDDVVGRHREPHRRYHGVRHVTWVVRHVHELTTEVAIVDAGAVTAAAFFHDAVYDPRRHDNEDQSAALAERALGALGWPTERGARVAAMVRATRHHEPTGDPDTDVLDDADLAVLGSDPASYQGYVSGVRGEYDHVDSEAWRVGRGAVLESFLARPSIYATAPGRARWEARARANLTAELTTLLSGGGGRGPG